VRDNEENPEKGQVLWSASFPNRPQFSKTPDERIGYVQSTGYVQSFDSDICGFFTGESPVEEISDEWHYVDRTQTRQLTPEARLRRQNAIDRDGYDYREIMKRYGEARIIKWRLQTDATVKAGTRLDQSLCGSDPMTLNVYSQGAAVGIYTWHEQDSESTQDPFWSKKEYKFVDYIDFQLKKTDGTIVAQWRVIGDSFDQQSAILDNSMFYMNAEDGRKVQVTTKEGYDPTLCLLLAHVVNLEYSVDAIKSDFSPSFPGSP